MSLPVYEPLPEGEQSGSRMLEAMDAPAAIAPQVPERRPPRPSPGRGGRAMHVRALTLGPGMRVPEFRNV